MVYAYGLGVSPEIDSSIQDDVGRSLQIYYENCQQQKDMASGSSGIVRGLIGSVAGKLTKGITKGYTMYQDANQEDQDDIQKIKQLNNFDQY